jgi:DNA-binding NarL/FixJ family response regulator
MTFILRDVTESREAATQIKNQQTDLKNLNTLLGEKNTALREVISQLQQEKVRIEERVLINVERLLLPTLENMQKKGSSFDLEYIKMLEKGLHELVSPFGEKLTSKMYSLTTREIEICNLIKNGFSSKEIGAQLNISYRTVQTQRNVIRKKLNILNQDINLRTFLHSL